MKNKKKEEKKEKSLSNHTKKAISCKINVMKEYEYKGKKGGLISI